MNKLLKSLSLFVAIAALSALAGCDLYFGNNNSSDNWTYCGSDGFYQCTGDNCTWVSPTCPAGSGSGSSTDGGTGYGCTSNNDCSAGCYCSGGTCTEGGFCTSNSDCGPGFFCDTNRSSCEPGCTADSDCSQGQVCDTSTSTCTMTCSCTTDADAVNQGYGYCDETRMTCEPGIDPNGSCAGDITCNTAAPTCPSGQVPLIYNGCYTGSCEAIAACSTPPSCSAINDATDCEARQDCSEVDTGIDCTKPDGTACHAGDTNCTCASYVFNSCADKAVGARVLINSSGQMVPLTGNR